MSRRGRIWVRVAAALAVAVAVAAVVVPVPFLSRSPGPVFDLLGEADGEPVLRIEGTETFPTTGRLDMTTVAEVGGPAAPLSAVVAALDWLSPSASVIPDTERRTLEDRDLDVAVFDASQTYALAAAADYLDRPVRAVPVVVRATPDSPADGVLRAGDEIRAVDGRPVRRAQQVGSAIAAQPAGTDFRLRIVRAGERRTVEVTSEESEEAGRPVIGILVENSYSSDFEAALDLDGIGGPSAGAMLAVAMVDKLTPGPLLGDDHVAGTGTITPAGEVGVISGVDKKMAAAAEAGARLFLAPRGNCPDIVGAAPDGLTVVPVDSLSGAIDTITAWRAGRQVQSCPADPPSDDND